MPRPRKRKRIGGNPSVLYFKPKGIPINELESVELSHEEFEALRLKYVEKYNQIKSAKQMNISQSTFQRLLLSAHQVVADGIVNGKAIQIKENLY